MTFAFLLTLAALLIVGFKTWRLAVRLDAEREAHAEESDALMVENKRLRMQRDSAQADLALVSDFHEYNTDVLRRVAAERDELQAVDERTFALPTLAGIRDESRDNPPDAVALAEELRKDFEERVASRALVEAVAPKPADVTPIKKRAKP